MLSRLAAGESLLSPRLKNGDSNSVGKVETAIAGAHGERKKPIWRKFCQDVRRQSPCFRPKDKHIAGQEGYGVITLFCLAAQGKKASPGESGAAGLPIGMRFYVGIFVIIQSGAAQLPVFQGKAKRLNQMQFAAGIGGKANDIAGVGRNFRLEKDNGKHGVRIEKRL